MFVIAQLFIGKKIKNEELPLDNDDKCSNNNVI